MADSIEKLLGAMNSTVIADALENPSSVFCCDDCKYNQPRGTCKKECRKAIIEWIGEDVSLDRSELI
jgi:hypothetical protein